MVSIRDVADSAGVAVGTVSKYLNTPQQVSAGKTKLIRKAIRDLGYVRNDAARQLRAGRSNTLGFVALELSNPFFGDVVRSAERRAAQKGLVMVLVSSNGDREREAQYVDLLLQQRVYGVVLASGMTQDRDLDLLFDRGIPTVLLDAYPQSDRFSSARVDDFLGAKQAVQHLIAEGCRSIAFVGGEESVHQIAERSRGARAAVDAHGGVTLETIPTSERTIQAGREIGAAIAARPARRRRPDGIFTANDSIAIGLMQVLSSSGIRIPHDIAIVGYDDIDFATSAVVPLTTVRRPGELLGRAAVDLMVDQAEFGSPSVRDMVIQPELVIRASSLRGSTTP
ncbi:MAG TPA: LacI family DNA-binding transcriptional regulator [Vicinamibacterales bacterium]|nr:LacI family DNA-binding transcriptional regulator [Vicinamibacterales bacterium]